MNFHIGDRVQLVRIPELIWVTSAKPGAIGVVASELSYAPSRENTLHWSKAHAVEFSNGVVEWFIPQCLRKLDDGKQREPLGSWDECPWHPQVLEPA